MTRYLGLRPLCELQPRLSHDEPSALKLRRRLQLSFKGAVEDGRKQGIQLGGGLGLPAFQRVRFRHDPALLGG